MGCSRTQIRGKRFILRADLRNDVNQHAFLVVNNARARKSQRILDSIQAKPILDEVIEHGKGVYIPAFFPHHCEVISYPTSKSVSISLNAFAPSCVGTTASNFLTSLSMHPGHGPTAAARLLDMNSDRLLATRQMTHDRYSLLLGLPPTILRTSITLPSPSLPQPVEDALSSFHPGHDAVANVVACHAMEIAAVQSLQGSRSPSELKEQIAELFT